LLASNDDIPALELFAEAVKALSGGCVYSSPNKRKYFMEAENFKTRVRIFKASSMR
jgi:hypothetical protein